MKRTIKIFMVIAALMIAGAALTPQKAQACCSCTGTVTTTSTQEWFGDGGTEPRIKAHVDSELTAQRVWLTSILWEDNILPALMMMTEQFTAVAMQQVSIFGGFMDAKHQMETQQVLQRLKAQTHKDYQPSTGMCEIGSNIKSLAASERKGEFNAVVMSQRSQDRQLGNANTSARTGEGADRESRVQQFRTKFCDPRDNNDGLAYMCDHDQDGNPSTGGTGASKVVSRPFGGSVMVSAPERMNKDIDFVRTVESPWTLNIDFTDETLTPEEEEVLALSANLYGHDIFARPSSTSLQSQPGEELTEAQSSYLDMRSVIAKRSVAENSFNAITAMKSAGLPGSKDYMEAILEELGVSDIAGADASALIGENPSYYAQMEVLTKKIYQNPDFYTNLYDKPANVDRKGVALQAIGLMQKFDLFKSYLRQESSLSVLLELAVMDLQEEIENQINEFEGRGSE